MHGFSDSIFVHDVERKFKVFWVFIDMEILKTPFFQKLFSFLQQSTFIEKKITFVRFIGPTMYHAENAVSLSWNIYPQRVHINTCYNMIVKEITALFNSYFDGELIKYTANSGEIYDQRVKSFLIRKAELFESYWYEIESFVYIRVMIEKSLDEKVAHALSEWISVDIDIVQRSPWFSENVKKAPSNLS